MKIKGAGILPICKKKDKIFVLCGIGYDKKIYDFGGKIEKNESIINCAIREFYEESVGLLDTYDKILNYKIYDETYCQYDHNKYYKCYITIIEYIDIEKKYDKLLKYIIKNKSLAKDMKIYNYTYDKLYIENVYPKGFFEFYTIKWISLNKLIKNKNLSHRLKGIITNIFL
jgi:hypothetical protein